MKGLLAIGIALAALTTGSAMAADLGVKAPVMKAPPLPTWNGFYIGVDGGYGWATGNVTEDPFQSFPGSTVIPPAAFSQTLDGAIFGVHAGFNFQVATFVLGVEGDFDGSGINNSSQVVLPDPLNGSGGTATDGFMAHQDIRWLASARARLGVPLGSSLLYVTGGGAWESLRTNVLLSADTAGGVYSESGAASFTSTKSGYVVGAGYEWMINPNWIARAEFLHYGFSGASSVPVFVTSCATGGAGATCGGNVASSDNNVNVGRVGLSYKF